MPQAPKKVFLFNLLGEFQKSFRGAAECAEHIGSQRQTISNAASRKSLVNGKYYISYEPTFELPELKYENNRMKIASSNKVRQVPTLPGKRLGRSVQSFVDTLDPEMESFLSSRYMYG